MSAVTLYRLNPGNYVTDKQERPGSYVVYRYHNENTGHADGWMICRWELTDIGYPDLVSKDWADTLGAARELVAMHLRWDAGAKAR